MTGVGAPDAAEARVDALPAGVLALADDGSIRFVNATLLAMLGYARADELLGRHVESLLALPGRLFYQTHLFPLLRMHGAAEEIFLLLRARDGEEVATLLNATRHERDGEARTDCVLLRLQERRKFEDELLRAKRVAEEARAVVERRQREMERLNEQLAQQAVELELQQQLLEEQTTELLATRDDLQRVNAHLLARTEELERQRARADEANRAKGDFLAVMSHELRTPLNAIGGYVQLLELGIHGPLTGEQREALERTARSQRHLLRLVNDVLNFARVESGRVEYHTGGVGLAEVVASVMPMVDPQLGAKALRTDIVVPPDLVASADEEKVQQILLNLLTNAIKFTPAGGRIAIVGAREGVPAERVALHVSDTGIGIPAGQLDGVFEPFVQVDVSHTRRNEGTGLGLAISRDLARGMRGDLTVRSEVGLGSTFTLTLPAAGTSAA